MGSVELRFVNPLLQCRPPFRKELPFSIFSRIIAEVRPIALRFKVNKPIREEQTQIKSFPNNGAVAGNFKRT